MQYCDVTFATRDAAELILAQMETVIKEYGRVSIADFMDLTGHNSGFMDNMYGWSNLTGATVYKSLDGYRINFPHTQTLTAKKRIETIEYEEEEEEEEDDETVVNHPSHYQSQSGLETIQVIDAFTADLVGTEAVCTGNVLKYICRWKHKNGLQDLKKAKWYLEHLINHLEKESE